MPDIARYLSHPQVTIDPAVPVPRWGLNAVGRARTEKLARAPWLAATRLIVASDERKAVETAEILAVAIGAQRIIREAMHENDRSATGFLPPEEFERTADEFFAQPHRSVRGWERAVDAQRRIVGEVNAVLADAPAGEVLFVGHGGVGTLLLCHLSRQAIDRRHDQPAGGGNYFAFDASGPTLLHGWRPMEQDPDTRRGSA